MILSDAQRIAAMLGDDVSKAGLGRASIRKNLWPGAVLIYQLDPAIGIHESTYSPMDEGLTYIRGTQRQFSENICSEDDFRSRIFGIFVVKLLACLPLLGFSNI